jgi:anti-sigma B factor antagonist
MPSAFVQVQVYKKDVLIEITKDRILDAATINEIAAAIQEVLDRVPKISLVLDLSKVTAMSSQMLGKLVAVHKEVKKGKGRLAVAGVAASMKQLFKITKLDKMLDMHDDPQKVLMTYQRKPL